MTAIADGKKGTIFLWFFQEDKKALLGYRFYKFIVMIKNNLQYQITDKKRAQFKAALAELKEKKDINPLLKEIQTNALIAQIEMFEEEMEEYKISNTQATATTQSI